MTPTYKMLARYLDTNGDGTGTKNATGNYAVTATSFYIQPPPGSVYRVARVLIHVSDSGSFDSGSYGNAITLTNGITAKIADDTQTLVDLTDGLPILVNPHWGRLCYDVNVSAYGSGDEHIDIRWTLEKSGTLPQLVGDRNERLEIVLNDNFSGLVSQYFMAQGYIEK